MPQFARRARWLAELFTPSVAPTTSYPDRYSKDVSLTQPYDGGGWGLTDPGQFTTGVTSATSAAANTELILTAADEIFRVLAVSCILTAGVSPTVALSIRSPTAVNVGCALPVAITAGFQQPLLLLNLSVLPPETSLRGVHSGGDAATIVDWFVYGLRLPLGASPVI